MSLASPCVGTCRLDDATGWCLGCARSGQEIAEWRGQSDTWRAGIWGELPSRFQQLGVACRRLPWETGDIRDFVLRSLREARGTWVVGVVGAVAEFTARPGEGIEVRTDGAGLIATTAGGALRFLIDDDVRALCFDPPDGNSDHQRIVLAVSRERGRLPVTTTIADLGADSAAIGSEERGAHLFDLGLGRKEARFAVRSLPGAAKDALSATAGTPLQTALPRIGPVLVRASPTRVVESALGRIEVTGAIPGPGEPTAAGPHTHLLPDHLATGRALPAGMDLPRAYLPGAIFYPAG